MQVCLEGVFPGAGATLGCCGLWALVVPFPGVCSGALCPQFGLALLRPRDSFVHWSDTRQVELLKSRPEPPNLCYLHKWRQAQATIPIMGTALLTTGEIGNERHSVATSLWTVRFHWRLHRDHGGGEVEEKLEGQGCVCGASLFIMCFPCTWFPLPTELPGTSRGYGRGTCALSTKAIFICAQGKVTRLLQAEFSCPRHTELDIKAELEA